ncbi:MAG: YhgE/Pip domain-containing protein [Bifidobacterium sp.]|nr:YhgE/Pip domain-containing protein [Bifidobacterium sp.]
MRNTLFILRRDLKRLLKAPTAWVVLFGLIFLPGLYAWCNVAGFWDPYSSTSGLKVAVANQDEGADSSLMGKMDLGKQVVDQLKDNHELGWTFLDKAEAMDCVESGECYAAIVIPKDFSKDLSNVLTSDGDRPKLEYYVNEKLSPVGTKITGTGASTLDDTINSTFVSTVSSVVADTVNKANTEIGKDADSTVAKVSQQLDKTQAKLKDTRTKIAKLEQTLANTKTKTDQAKQALDQVQSAASTAGSGLTEAGQLITHTQGQLNTFIDNAGKQFDQGSSLFMRASGSAEGDATKVSNGVITASGYTSSALNELKSVNETNAQILAQLRAIDVSDISATAEKQLDTLVAQLQQDNQQTATAISTATTLNDQTAQTAADAQDTVNQFGTASQTTLDSINKARSTLTTGALPQLNQGLSSLASTSGTLGAAAQSQNSLVAQTKIVLDQLAKVATDTSTTLKSTNDLLATFEDKIADVNTDVKALAGTDLLSALTGKDGSLDVKRIADFMLSPTVLKTHTLYPVATYGEGMVPLFGSMALWVGVFMLMCLVHLEVDDEGLEGRHVTFTQKYMARYLLLAIIATFQAIVTCAGLLVIGVRPVNTPMFILTAVLCSWSYLAIAYALSTMFMHVGKALVVALLMVQIPGANGMYPIQMMPRFFRILYPLFPFNYGGNAWRETIAGFYDGTWVKNILVLALFAAIAFFCGIVIRPLIGNLNHMFARELNATDMVIAERVEGNRRFGLGQIMHVLADKDSYRKQIERRAQRFSELYPKLMRGALIAGLVVPLILAVTFSFTDGTKLVALATWVIWILVIIQFLLIVEYMRESLNRQAELGTLNDASLRDLLLHNGGLQRTSAKHGLGTRLADAVHASAASADHDDDYDDADDADNTATRADDPVATSSQLHALQHLHETLELNLRDMHARFLSRKKGVTHHGRHEATAATAHDDTKLEDTADLDIPPLTLGDFAEPDDTDDTTKGGTR